MFTGIITDVGEVLSAQGRGDVRLRIGCAYDAGTIDAGASIACAGVCLTVVGRGKEGGRNWFDVEASRETCRATTLGRWRPGTRVNLERALKVGDELGGHIVSGHVDGLARILSRAEDGDSVRLELEAGGELMAFMAAKGSITLDGTSFTLNEVSDRRFTINIIPHTLQVTTWTERKPGDEVNVEIDMLARYVARLREVAGERDAAS